MSVITKSCLALNFQLCLENSSDKGVLSKLKFCGQTDEAFKGDP